MTEPTIDVKDIIASAWTWATIVVPPLRLIPLDVVFAVIDAVNAGVTEGLRPEVNVKDWPALIKLLKEVAENAIVSNEKQRREAIYAALVYFTDVEDKMTLEEFMRVEVA